MEIGGRLVVEDASFTIMPRDKVGLVGRNGAGKTSFFKVLGGEAEPVAGRIVRKGGFGYLPQDPKIAGLLDGRTAIAHVLSGRGIDDQLMRIEKLRIAMEEDTSDRNVAEPPAAFGGASGSVLLIGLPYGWHPEGAGPAGCCPGGYN